VAAVHKLQSLAIFRSALDEYRLMPRNLSGIAAVLVVTAELLAALLVLIPGARTAGLVVMVGLLLIYTAGISINLLRDRRNIDCGCSGPSSRHELSGWLVLRNLLLSGLVLLALAPVSARPLNWLDLLVIVFGVLIAGGLYLGMNQMLAQAPRIAALRSGS
jgi:4-hydroxybenzoate polyprenyltransferase